MNLSITELIKGAPVLAPNDTLKRAASLLRASDGSSTVVIDGGQIVGIITEKAIAAALAQAPDSQFPLDTPVRSLMDPGILYVNSGATVQQAAGIFAASDVDALPVINGYGGYLGVIYRGDLVGYMTRGMKMPPVAGMATPLGVYLTTGSVSGGAGSFGLFLSGLTLGVLMVVAHAISVGILGAMGHIPLHANLHLPALLMPHWVNLQPYLSMILNVIVFVVLLRLSSLAGYHAAEHMTVHAIEAGEALKPEIVGKMPRAHPRCGTNILTGITLFLLVTYCLQDQSSLMLAALVAVLFWRSIGGWMQQYVTTKPPSARELASGIAAGNQLIERFHERPNHQEYGLARIWRMGLLQNAAGLMLVSAIVPYLAAWLHIPWLSF